MSSSVVLTTDTSFCAKPFTPRCSFPSLTCSHVSLTDKPTSAYSRYPCAMAGQKRKRDAPSTPQTSKKHAAAGALTPRDTESPGPDSSTTPPFTIEYLRDVNSKPPKKRRGNKELDYTPGLLEQSVDGTEPVAFTILPGSNWLAMRKYKNFVGTLSIAVNGEPALTWSW